MAKNTTLKTPEIKIAGKKVFKETGLTYIELSAKLRSGKTRKFVVERAIFADPKGLHRFFLSMNAQLPTNYIDAKPYILELIGSENVRAIDVVNSMGMYGKTFVTAHGSYGADPGIEVYEMPEPKDQIVVGMTSGNLRGYLKAIKPVVAKSRILRLLLGAQCASVVASLVLLKEPAIFHLGGPSGTGKTALMRLTMAMIGRANEEDPKTYSATEAGLEDYFFFYRNTLTVIDELGTKSSDPKELVKLMTKLSYVFASRKGRQLTAIYKKMTGKSQRTWNQFGVSSGEKTLKELAAECGERVPEGALRRLIDVPVTKDQTVLDIHKEGSQPSESKALNTVIKACEGVQKHHGVALKKLVEWAVANGRVREEFDVERQKFMSLVGVNTGWQHAVVKKLAECCAGGVLGIRAGVIPCAEAQYTASIRRLCHELLKYSSPSFFDVKKLAVSLVKSCGDNSKVIVKTNKGKYPALDPQKSLGYVLVKKGKKFAILFPKRLDELTGSRNATRDLAEHLKAHNRLWLGSRGSLTQPVDIPGQPKQIRCYRLKLKG